ncbi:MAG TPA: hypothetical protein PK425_09965, partial [Syntrophales bacterium]|nr:hypothetical protein [Syntrophales bacterium]
MRKERIGGTPFLPPKGEWIISPGRFSLDIIEQSWDKKNHFSGGYNDEKKLDLCGGIMPGLDAAGMPACGRPR